MHVCMYEFNIYNALLGMYFSSRHSNEDYTFLKFSRYLKNVSW